MLLRTNFNSKVTFKSLSEFHGPSWLMKAQMWKTTLACVPSSGEGWAERWKKTNKNKQKKTQGNLALKLAARLIYEEPVVLGGGQTCYGDQICATEPRWKFDLLPEYNSGIHISPANAGCAMWKAPDKASNWTLNKEYFVEPNLAGISFHRNMSLPLCSWDCHTSVSSSYGYRCCRQLKPWPRLHLWGILVRSDWLDERLL